MADLLRDHNNPNGPLPFEPSKIKSMGFASSSNDIPSIYFSGSETKQLADNLGYAIVGKFSHSIPATYQIQKSLDNMRFARGFSWKYINAKHILIQLEDLANYAKLLNEPKDMPVWFVDRHPMRVFKWSPEFDVFCESPVAAIWCNLIGLPIHLFDHSALFAIGKLLGNPIQIDRATANKTRLSFARICLEIDITKPAPEEIILDICGRESIQRVKWDKIPSFCSECKHVGHATETCYAFGKKERPPRRNFDNNTARGKGYNDQSEKGNAAQKQGKRVIYEWHRAEKEGKHNSNHDRDEGTDLGVLGAYHDPQSNNLDIIGPPRNEEEWEHSKRGGRKQGRKTWGPSGINTSNNNADGAQPSHSMSSRNKRGGTTSQVKKRPTFRRFPRKGEQSD
ncbi:uncharacterized protein LOC121809061 [Salvia splendens]|uniref:uncharacterized protein LOC121809061 n=1 Tax=Salvia splendens TaxID=180675 RepID=UPI001C26F94C|nr:uncharacterized protein LOC121809061 [Salvia splendens]